MCTFVKSGRKWQQVFGRASELRYQQMSVRVNFVRFNYSTYANTVCNAFTFVTRYIKLKK